MPQPSKDLNPFPPQRGGPGLVVQVSTEQARVLGEIQIARQFPRDPHASMDRILVACTQPALAEGATYAYSRGKGEDEVLIHRPSIRLAEVACREWGNIRYGLHEVDQKQDRTTLRAFAADLETNTSQERTFTVPHLRETRTGTYAVTGPRDVYELVTNFGVRRMRACMEAAIPAEVWERAMQQCTVTMERLGARQGDDRLTRMVRSFDTMGVRQPDLERLLDCELSEANAEQLNRLRSIHSTLRDGMAQPGDFFPWIDQFEAGESATPDELNGP